MSWFLSPSLSLSLSLTLSHTLSLYLSRSSSLPSSLSLFLSRSLPPFLPLSPSHDTSDFILHVEHLPLFLQNDESRVIMHFHYTHWPDFGVPQNPDVFLEYLYAVRNSGCLSPDSGPAVVHCSAGIGRSGTFCLVDVILTKVSTCIHVSVCILFCLFMFVCVFSRGLQNMFVQ